MDNEIREEVMWPFWLELSFAVLIPIIILWSCTPTNVLHTAFYGPALQTIGSAGGFLQFYGGIPVGIIGLVKARRMDRRRGITRILSVANLCTGLVVVGSIVLVICAVIFGNVPY